MNALADALHDLITRVDTGWRSDPTVYPKLALLTEHEDRFHFLLGHTAHHVAKTAGNLATQAERAEHGRSVDVAALRVDMVKGLVSALYLAVILEMSAEDILEEFSKNFPELSAPSP